MNPTTTTQWIPCTQELPDEDQPVLIALSDGEVWTGFLDEGNWRFESADLVDQGEGHTVTHWAHIPAHPNAELRDRSGSGTPTQNQPHK